jgi:hypothetical protein
MTEKIEELFTVQAIAKQLNKCDSSVYFAYYRGRLPQPIYKAGRSLLWTKAQVETIKCILIK